MSEQNNFGFDPIPLGSRPGADITSMGLLPPLPKPAQPVEPRTAAPKPPEPPPAPVVKAAAIETAKPKPPLPGRFAWLPEATRMLFKPTRQKGVIAAGIASLACGALVANYMWPAPKPVVEVAKVEPAAPAAPAPEATPIPEVKTVVNLPEVVPGIPAPVVPPIPSVIVGDVPTLTTTTPPPPLIVLPALPNEKKDEQVKPAGGVPEISLPTIPQSPAPVLPNVNLPETTAMVVPPVKLPDLTSPPVKSPPPPETKPAPPVLPVEKPPVPPVVIPESKPSAPPPPIDLTPPVVLPDAPKVDAPRVDVAPPKIDVTPPPPAAIPDVKPAAPLPDVKPAAGMAPREDYDVDVHYPKSGDNWTSISKDLLGDDRYAEALRAYNGGRALAANQGVDVPPIHVLRKNYPHLIAAPKAAAEPAPMKPAAGQRTYEVPAGGLALKELARKALGDENLWGQIWELNPKLRADEPVPAGTKVKLPADARIGE